MRASLLNLLRLLVENMSELVMDDRWLSGQIEVVREIIDKPFPSVPSTMPSAASKEVVKQNQLKHTASTKLEALKAMLAGFVDQLADFADATSSTTTCASNAVPKRSVPPTTFRNWRPSSPRSCGDPRHPAQRPAFPGQRATQQRVQESEARSAELELELVTTSDLVRHDQLTGVLNRRGSRRPSPRDRRANRHETLLCAALLDLDNFKKLNDSLGHDAGDSALIHLATVCRNTLRPQDAVARHGGEEFIILLPDTGLDDAINALTRLQRADAANLYAR